MNFFSSHYEKVILLFFLVLFIVMLLLQVNFMQNVQNQKINAIMQKVEPPTDQKAISYSDPVYSIDSVFNKVVAWNKGTVQGAAARTGLLNCYELAVCPFCKDLIRSDYFPTVASPTTRNCPVCYEQLKIKQKAPEQPVAQQNADGGKQQLDSNNNSVPDDWERSYNVFSSSADDIDRDHDEDFFTTWEEYKLQKYKPNNAKSHPAYINCITFVRLNVREFKNLRFRGVDTHPGQNVKDWSLKLEYQGANARRPRISISEKIGSRFKHGREEFEILNCYPDNLQRPGAKTYITIRRVGTNETIVCHYMKPVYDPIQEVVLRNSHPKQTIVCKIGESFRLGNEKCGVEVYKVLSADEQSAVVQGKNKKKIKIDFTHKLGEIEKRPGSNASEQTVSSDSEFKPIQIENDKPRRPVNRRRRGIRR